MGRTYKRNPNADDLDDPMSFDTEDDEQDLLDWMVRPNEARRDPDVSRGRRPASGRAAYRGLPDDWRDFDYGADAFDSNWR